MSGSCRGISLLELNPLGSMNWSISFGRRRIFLRHGFVSLLEIAYACYAYGAISSLVEHVS